MFVIIYNYISRFDFPQVINNTLNDTVLPHCEQPGLQRNVWTVEETYSSSYYKYCLNEI